VKPVARSTRKGPATEAFDLMSERASFSFIYNLAPLLLILTPLPFAVKIRHSDVHLSNTKPRLDFGVSSFPRESLCASAEEQRERGLIQASLIEPCPLRVS
jgi:hypothetical protein